MKKRIFFIAITPFLYGCYVADANKQDKQVDILFSPIEQQEPPKEKEDIPFYYQFNKDTNENWQIVGNHGIEEFKVENETLSVTQKDDNNPAIALLKTTKDNFLVVKNDEAYDYEYKIEFKINNHFGDRAYFGLVFNYNDQNKNKFCTLQVNTPLQLEFGTNEKKNTSIITEVWQAKAINNFNTEEDEGWNTLEIRKVNKYTVAFLNGKNILENVQNLFSGDKVGIILFNVDVTIRKVVLEKL